MGGKEHCGGKGGDTYFWAVSLWGAGGTKIGKPFPGESSLLPPRQAGYFAFWSQSRFEVLGLGQQPLSFPVTFIAMGLLTWSFCRSAPSDAMHGVALHSPGTARMAWRRWGHASRVPMGWANQSLNGLWEQLVPHRALQSCTWWSTGIFRGTCTIKLSVSPQGEPAFTKAPRAQAVWLPVEPLNGSESGGWQSGIGCSLGQRCHAKPPAEEASAECSDS